MAHKRLTNPRPLTDETLRSIPRQSGVYVFSDKNGTVLDVGSAGAGRLREEVVEKLRRRPDIAERATQIQIRATERERDARRLERQYQDRLKPTLTRRRG